jgi:hypothetical protein
MTTTDTSADFSQYPDKACHSLMQFVRRRIKVGRYIPGCEDLARQFAMDAAFVARLLEARLRESEKPEWRRLTGLPHDVPAVRSGKPMKPTSRPGPAKPKGTSRSGPLRARGWEKYPMDQLERLRDYVLVEMEQLRRGEGMVTSYYVLREMFGVSVGVMGDFLRSDTGIGESRFAERKRYSKIRR